MSAGTTLYIAGPMRGIEAFNFPAFLAASEDLEKAGYETVNPARRDLANGFVPTGCNGNEDLADLGFDLRDALAWDLDQIARECDGVATLDGWEGSKGANAEVATAKALGLEVKSVDEWVKFATPEVGDTVTYLHLTGTLRDIYGEWRPGGDCLVEWTEGFPEAETLRATHSSLTVVKKAQKVEWGDPAPITVAALHEQLTEMAGDFAEVAALPSGEEVRITSETGGQKGSKPAQLSTVDPLALLELAKVSGFGARKYESFNYLRGYDWRLSADAAFRHLLACLSGEDRDPESGFLHAAHFAWHGLALTSFALRGIGTDDRVETVLANYREESA